MRYKWVTLIELLIWLSILAVWLVAIVNILNWWLENIDKIRQETIAINLAREWVEWVYNIRNTNWIKRAWVKDKCWLKIDPLIDEGNDWDCSNDTRMQKWHYILSLKQNKWQKYFYLQNSNVTWLDMTHYDKWIDDKYNLCYTWSYRMSCPWQINSRSEWMFFREIEWKWLFQKDTTTDWWKELICKKWTDTYWWIDCWWSNAKEFRFCSKVQYFKNYLWTIELCAIITNFEY